jgi:hypothetical protein
MLSTLPPIIFIRRFGEVNHDNEMSALQSGILANSLISLHGLKWKKAVLPSSMAAMSTLSGICRLSEENKGTIGFNFASG